MTAFAEARATATTEKVRAAKAPISPPDVTRPAKPVVKPVARPAPKPVFVAKPRTPTPAKKPAAPVMTTAAPVVQKKNVLPGAPNAVFSVKKIVTVARKPSDVLA
jgi:hypothetical protein